MCWGLPNCPAGMAYISAKRHSPTVRVVSGGQFHDLPGLSCIFKLVSTVNHRLRSFMGENVSFFLPFFCTKSFTKVASVTRSRQCLRKEELIAY
ncbi:hypothetical protein K443DRAFT_371983 [Laccaria amethystina LaAM-08-1]|uniref:Unplaced genomic scaffold K443scaffold_278, whole genome shotgun sequence n=1 Tax=Laccaria amethystina LaAM-08-1 TaxID=1095629 RepID=A0A0C9WJ40_9AGAR|nr:hypothetical protein K443DRAFT_371983 [Laccaria amethystina LaAM-08-1]